MRADLALVPPAPRDPAIRVQVQNEALQTRKFRFVMLNSPHSDRPETRRTAAILLTFGVVVVILTILAAVSLSILSILRAYVGGESAWSKGEKDAIFALQEYASSGSERDFRQHLDKLNIPLGDLAAKLEMNKAEPDYDVVRRGLIAGGIAEQDIDGMAWLYRRSKNLPLMRQAVEYWDRGDISILQLQDVGQRLHVLVSAGEKNSPATQVLLARLKTIDEELAPSEEGYSRSLGAASRRTTTALITALVISALMLLAASATFVRRSLAHGNRLQAKLVESEERLSLGFRGSNAGLWDWNIARKHTYYSSWISELLGYEQGEFSGSSDAISEFVHTDDLEYVRGALRLHLKENRPYDVEFRLKTSTGTFLWCKARGQAIRNEHGFATRMVGSLLDITDRKIAEAKAHAEHELAQVTLASIADAVIRTDEAGRITYCNRVSERIFKRSSADMLMLPFREVCKTFNQDSKAPPCDVLERVLRAEIASQTSTDLYLLGGEGERIWVEQSVASVHDAEDKVIGSVIVLHDVTEKRKHAARLSYQATHDELTDILNRGEFERRLNALLERNFHEYSEHAVLCLDLDQFKIINDTCGHAAGNDLLRSISSALKRGLRDTDIIGRLGGDEFGVVLTHCSREQAIRTAEALRQTVAELGFVWANRIFSTGVSVGLVTPTPGMRALKDVMKAADLACYMAKEKGKNRVQVFSYEDEELSARHNEMEWVARLKSAIQRDKFCLYAQKVMALGGAEPSPGRHVEILLRMLDEDGQVISPMVFIPPAERFGLMPEIDRWVIRNAFAALAAAIASDTSAVQTWAINLSGASIGDDGLLAYIIEQQGVSGIPLSSVVFEITETAAITNFDKAATLIDGLHELGCRFALDDFGAGMSSFTYLKNLNVDFLKIDGSFVKEILDKPCDRAIVESINQVGHAMGKQTIAEFAESEEIVACLTGLGVDYAQGYAIGHPEPLSLLLAGAPRAGVTVVDDIE
jgi:diguanylate cyclase (GGDEF)-like protein/PAS domain S-box-containing protein